jgi:hypothetical protein
MMVSYSRINESTLKVQTRIDEKTTRIGVLVKQGGRWLEPDGQVVNVDENTIVEKTAEQQAFEAVAKQAAQAREAKRQGKLIAGVQISLTEDNQNGIASVMQGADLAAEAGMSIFPLNFNAMTAAGEQMVTFADMAEFKAFALEFMAARQQYF